MALTLGWGAPLTIDDLEKVPDDGHRYEILDGMLLVTPAPNTSHQTCVLVLGSVLLAAAGPGYTVLPAPYDWVIGPGTSFQPDIVVARTADVGPLRLERTPLLVVEVLSPSTRLVDLNLKRAAYEAAGVPAYWLVDPVGPSLTVLRLDEGARYIEEASVAGTDAHHASHPFPVTVVPAALLRGGSG
ncbi:MAG: Uma2 family endonuclease [Acidimicrobiales bacterium]